MKTETKKITKKKTNKKEEDNPLDSLATENSLINEIEGDEIKFDENYFPDVTEFIQNKPNTNKILGFGDLEYDTVYRIDSCEKAKSQKGNDYFFGKATKQGDAPFKLFMNKNIFARLEYVESKFKENGIRKKLFIIKKMKLTEDKKSYSIISKLI